MQMVRAARWTPTRTGKVVMVGSSGSMAFAALSRMGSTVRETVFVGRIRQPLYKGPWWDDLLFNQPVNVPLRGLRALLRSRSNGEVGVTVLIVNYNSRDLLESVIPAVRRFSPASTRITVLDNASSDSSWSWLRTRPFGIRSIRLPVNIGHGRALDIGLLLARTEVVVTLDSDAFPYSDDWLRVLLEPLEVPTILASGARGPRDRLHPALAAYRKEAVLATGLSFHNFNLHRDLGEEPVFGQNTWDTGELIFEAFGSDSVRLLPTERDPSGFGQRIADVAYHHTGMTTGLTDDPMALYANKTAMWEEAVERLLTREQRE